MKKLKEQYFPLFPPPSIPQNKEANKKYPPQINNTKDKKSTTKGEKKKMSSRRRGDRGMGLAAGMSVVQEKKQRDKKYTFLTVSLPFCLFLNFFLKFVIKANILQ